MFRMVSFDALYMCLSEANPLMMRDASQGIYTETNVKKYCCGHLANSVSYQTAEKSPKESH